MFNNFIFISLLAVVCSGCSMLSLESRESSFSQKRTAKEQEKRKVTETGTHALLNRQTTLNVEAKGNVTIHPPTTSDTTEMKLPSEEQLVAIKDLRYSRNTDHSSSSESTAEMEFHRKMSYLGGGLFLAAGVGCLLLVRSMGNLRREATKWGFPVESVGEAAGSMMKMLTDLTRMVDTENASILNLRGNAHNLDDSTLNQLDHQFIKNSEMKRVLDKLDNVKRSGSRY